MVVIKADHVYTRGDVVDEHGRPARDSQLPVGEGAHPRREEQVPPPAAPSTRVGSDPEDRRRAEGSHDRDVTRRQQPGCVTDRQQGSLGGGHRQLRVPPARWSRPEQVAADRPPDRVVEGHPHGDQAPEALGAAVDVATPVTLAALLVPEAGRVVGEPPGQGSVNEGRDDRQAGSLGGHEDVLVAVEGVGVDPPG